MLYRIVAVLALIGLLAGCNPTRRLPEGQSLLVRQQVEVVDRPSGYKVDNNDLTSVLRQRPNRRIIFLRFHLGVYNLVNPKRQAAAHQKRAKKMERKISRKVKRGKELTSKNLREMRADTLGWRDWLTNTVGERPVAFDSTLAERSRSQIQTVLAKNGYFGADVDYRVRYSNSKRKVKRLTYEVRPGVPYIIDTLAYNINDRGIERRADFLKATSTIREGDRFEVKKMDQERERITDYLNNRGYYSFSKDFITFKADSVLGNRKVRLDMNLRRPQAVTTVGDSTVTVDHVRYFIRNIYFHTDYNPADRTYEPTDTLKMKNADGVYILPRGELNLKPELLLYLLEFKPGDLYQKGRVDLTYRRIVQLPIVRSLNIRFTVVEDSDVALLDCDILMTQMKRQVVSAESGVTHRDGLFGLSGSLNFSHRNVFSGSELGRLTILGGVEAQQPLTLTQNLEIQRVDITDNIRFNTFEIGPEVTLNFNRFFPFKMTQFRRSNAPRTTLSAGFNYQNRPDYERQLANFRYGVTFVENAEKGSRIFWDVWELSTIKIEKSEAFNELLDRLNDVFLLTSYRDHLISSGRIGWVMNTQRPQVQRRYFFNRIVFEAAGNIPRTLFEIAGAQRDEAGSHTIAGIRFAQYYKIENDFRYYRRVDERNAAAFRVHVGSGIPGANLGALPFEKSFFGGGANGVRGWRPRTLGPGSYRDSTAIVTFNNIGEIILEGSVEYRFDLTNTLEGAFFVDVGNIWLFNEEETRPGSGFEWSTFAGELAWSAGVGFRFDFDFFLVRFDFAAQMKDPSKVPGERWVWEPKDRWNDFVQLVDPGASQRFLPPVLFNLGIGYPF